MIRKLLIAFGLAGLLLSPAKAADSTVAAMTAASALGGTEIGYLVQGGADRKATPRQYATYMESLISGDCTISADVITCTKTNGTSFSALATTTPATGVASFLATPSSANLFAALTTKTGSGGSAVFATGPTINSAILGTAAQFSFITGSTQCLHVDTSGNVSGAGGDCGTGGSGGVTSVSAGCGTSTGGSPITTTGTVLAALTKRANTTTSDPIVAADCGNVVTESNASAIAVAIAQAGTTGFGAGSFFSVCNIGAGTATITPTTSTIGGGATLAIAGGSAAAPVCYVFQSDGANYNIVDGPTVNASLLSTGTVAAARGGAGTVSGALKGDGAGSVSQAACADLSNGTALCSTTPGTGVATAAAANLSAAGGLSTTVASGTSAMGTGAIASATCATVVTTAATNTATTDVVQASFNGDPTAVTGYVPLTTGMLTIIAYPTANNVNFKVCNNTSSSITPGAITLNWRVAR